MTDPDPTYDEFSLFHENAHEVGLPFVAPPVVARQSVEVAPGRRVSILKWGEGPPELVLIHGGGQNAHTWDTVALALDRPLVAIDLPGHGHSDWPQDSTWLDVTSMADDLATPRQTACPGRHHARREWRQGLRYHGIPIGTRDVCHVRRATRSHHPVQSDPFRSFVTAGGSTQFSPGT
jgi:pimeloyl-ACP methyl ester carboxylesterase